MPDLFDLFKQNESKLYELPSEQVWKKLETRLEKRRRERRKIRFLQIGAVALVLIVLLLAAWLVWYFVGLGQGG
jgi:hypothetical protein